MALFGTDAPKLKASRNYAEGAPVRSGDAARTDTSTQNSPPTPSFSRSFGNPGPRPLTVQTPGSASSRLAAIFVRHGETTGNKENLVRGQKDYPLDASGKAEATEAGRTLAAHTGASTVFHSRLSRGRDTAKAIRDATGAKDVETQGLLPWNKGDAQGKPEASENPKLRVFATSKRDTPVPGGESHRDFTDRADAGAKSIVRAGKSAVASGKPPVAAVSHSVDMRRLPHQIEGKPEPDPLSGGPNPGEMMGVTMGNKVVKVKPGMWGSK